VADYSVSGQRCKVRANRQETLPVQPELENERSPLMKDSARSGRGIFKASGDNVLACYFDPRGCWTKNSHITMLASISSVVRPAIHSARCLPPGQVWPPPSIV